MNLHRYLYGEQTADLWANGKQDTTGGDKGNEAIQFCGLFQSSANDPFAIHRSYCTCPAPLPDAAASEPPTAIADGFVCKWKKCATDSAKPVCSSVAHLYLYSILYVYSICAELVHCVLTSHYTAVPFGTFSHSRVVDS